MRSYLKLSFSQNELKELLINLNLKDEILEKYPSQLSGGEATRVGILLALLSKPKILICDEITSGLDNETKQKIINLLLSLDEKISIIFITHDIRLARILCDEIVLLDSGKIAEIIYFSGKVNGGKQIRITVLMCLTGTQRPSGCKSHFRPHTGFERPFFQLFLHAVV